MTITLGAVQGYQRDMIAQQAVEITSDGRTVWCNLDGICVLRIRLVPGAAVTVELDQTQTPKPLP